MTNVVSLSQLNPGESATIYRIGRAGVTRRRILVMGFVRGTKITVIRRAPLGDPIEFRLKGYHLTLRKQEADLVYVTKD
ncbi:MAG: FeoA family protein [Candidatus Ranarchaeia archaeon]